MPRISSELKLKILKTVRKEAEKIKVARLEKSERKQAEKRLKSSIVEA